MITPTAGKLDHSYIVDGNVKWYNHPKKEFGSLFKTNKQTKPKYRTTVWPNNCPIEHSCQVNVNLCSHKNSVHKGL